MPRTLQSARYSFSLSMARVAPSITASPSPAPSPSAWHTAYFVPAGLSPAIFAEGAASFRYTQVPARFCQRTRLALASRYSSTLLCQSRCSVEMRSTTPTSGDSESVISWKLESSRMLMRSGVSVSSRSSAGTPKFPPISFSTPHFVKMWLIMLTVEPLPSVPVTPTTFLDLVCSKNS